MKNNKAPVEYRKAFVHRHPQVVQVREEVDLPIPGGNSFIGIANLLEDIVNCLSPHPAVEGEKPVGAFQMSSTSVVVFPLLDGGLVFVDNYSSLEDGHRGLAGTVILGEQTIELLGRLVGLLPSPTRPWKHYLPSLIFDAARGNVSSGDAESQGLIIRNEIGKNLAYQDWGNLVKRIGIE